MSSAEVLQAGRATREPSNLDVIGAYSPSDHLELFYVGNTANEKIYVLASSRRNSNIIAMMGGHIRALGNARHWKPVSPIERGSALSQAIKDRLPGVIWLRPSCVIARDIVFYDRKSKSKAER